MQAGVKVPIDKSLLLALRLDRKPIPGAGSSDRGGGTDKGSALWTAILMFHLSNGPCKLAPRRPEIHIFPRTCRLPIRQVMWANSPRGELRSRCFAAAVIFYPSRDDEEESGELGGDSKAGGGNGAENDPVRDQRGADERRQWQGAARQPPEGNEAAPARHGTARLGLCPSREPSDRLSSTRAGTRGHVCSTCLPSHDQNYGFLALSGACLSIWLWPECSERPQVPLMLQFHQGEGGMPRSWGKARLQPMG